VFVRSSLDELQCPCRDVGEAIPVASLRPIRTACKTLGGHILEHPSCGGFMPTAETTLFPAYSARSKRLLTGSVRLDNEANLIAGAAPECGCESGTKKELGEERLGLTAPPNV